MLTHKVLPNGLTISLKEIHTAPIISAWMWYRVGSRNEQPGVTGVSHWVEHMQFKGTPSFPGGVLDKAISREGGVWNAFTYLDWTTFFETMPSEKIDLAFALEADRMVNSVYDPEEVESERTVIISEREGSENEPLFRLGEAVQSRAFRVHPYHHEIIGEKDDLLTITRDDLYHHYRRHYIPNNAILVAAGDFDSAELLPRLEDVFGGLPAGEPPPPMELIEPPPDSEELVEVSGPGETTYLQFAYHSPAASDPDFYPYTVLDSLLTGPANLNMFGGGGISNKTSRLYRALVEKELAVSVSGGLQATIDPFLYDITVTVRPGVDPLRVIAAVDEEIRRLQQEDIPPAEIGRAIKQARAQFAYGAENITNQAFWLGYSQMFATYDWFLNYLERLEAVTPDQLQDLARTRLEPHLRVVGIYQPDGAED